MMTVIVFSKVMTQSSLKSNGKIYLDEKTWNYSNTTAKYRRDFLNEGIDSTRAKIKSGEYILTNLN